MAPSAKPRLTPEQVKKYKEDGYVIFKQPVLPPDSFKKLQEHFDRKLARLPADVRPEAMDTPHFTDPALFEWIFHPAVLDLVECILGPDLALFSTHFICKPGGHGKRVPWHEDSAYWGTALIPMEVCTVWLALDPSTLANGCMKVIPRTHTNGYSDYAPVDPTKNVFHNEILAAQRDDAKAVPIELEPNQCSLHDGRLMHGSEANTSQLRRCGYTIRFISAATKLNRESKPHYRKHNIYLARGTDKAGNEYADPTKSYPELALYQETHGYKGH